MPTLLHISDLHRTSDPRLSNDELISAILSDVSRWDMEGIPRPDLIVVSGDLIQGAGLGEPNADDVINAQYAEAEEFLKCLGRELVDSDRSRIVIVPGNHDVHWCRSLDAMTPIHPIPDGIAKKILTPNSELRWSWEEQRAYEISDQHLYASRFEHFCRFQANFYDGVKPKPIVDDDGELFYCEYPDLDLLVAGFASWYGNDCFCHVGEIGPASLAESQKLVAKSNMGIALAVWHHSISGGPRFHDYMDQHTVHKLIDFGFDIGLHGHQHFPGAAPFELRLPNRTSMIVVGAGSLAVGDNELPMGERRQFNIVVINPESKLITIHVRGMSPAGVFTGAHRDDFGGKTFSELSLPTNELRRVRQGILRRLDDAMTAIGGKKYEQALAILDELPASQATERRKIEIEALRGLGKIQKLIDILDPPQNVSEVVELIQLLLDEGRFDDAQNCLHRANSLVPASLKRELVATISARRMSE